MVLLSPLAHSEELRRADLSHANVPLLVVLTRSELNVHILGYRLGTAVSLGKHLENCCTMGLCSFAGQPPHSNLISIVPPPLITHALARTGTLRFGHPRSHQK